ncbi:MAG TPA: protein kinase [Anaerolineales bacterium]|nr:protein kinase [Anaerolineales bacterium]
MTNWVGKRLGKVQIESLVARGGIAEVYVGTHTTLGHKVAVKILQSRNEENSDALVRFQREARVIAKLRHPNIVQVHDFDTIENAPYLVMEYIEGPSLSRYLNALHQNNERLTPAQIVRLLDAVASALQYAHNNGVIHRDIKPGNILLTSRSGPILVGKPLPEDFEPVLTDFGLVRFLDSNRETTMGHIAGTPAYMSPEQARGESVDGRTDVYSLGIVLFEMLAGHIPFDGESTMSILLKQVSEPPPLIPGLHPLIEDVLDRALAKDVKDRFQTPMELDEAFRTALNTTGNLPTVQRERIPAEILLRKTGRAAKPGSQKRWIRIALLALMAIALGLVLFVRANSLPPAPVKENTATVPTVIDTTVSDTIPPPTATTTQPAPLPLGPSGILRFENGTALADQATVIAQAMPAPPAGSQYEAWLTSAKGRISLGVFAPDKTGQGEWVFTSSEGANLLGLYDRVEITIEPKPDTDPKSSGLIAYSFTFPAEGLTHLRYLLVAFPNTPDRAALIQGLYSDIKEIDKVVGEMQNSFEAGDKAAAQQKAESALNRLVGAQSADHKDWNGDGVTESRKSYGLLPNGSQFGYIRAAYGEADYLTNTAGATQYMISNGAVVKACAQNLASWAPQLRDFLLKTLTPESESEVSAAMQDAVALVDQMLNGIDLDHNGTVDTVAGECGAQIVYQFAYHMADMPLLPTSPSYQLTAGIPLTSFSGTQTHSSLQNGGGSQNTQPASTNPPQPKKTKKPNPTHNSPPTKKAKNANHP